jgi:hypothetical protein
MPSQALIVRFSVGLFVGLAALTATESAQAIPVIWGAGETIDHVRDLSPQLRAQLAGQFGGDIAIGFHYQRFHIYWLNFWTWDGEFVLYHDKKYWKPPSDQAWTELLGGSGLAQLHRPWAYTFPPGLVLLCTVLGVAVLKPLLFPDDQAKAARVLRDARYQEAMKQIGDAMRSAAKSGQTGARAAYESAHASAVQFLQDQGIAAATAERNLRTILRVQAPFLLPQPPAD